MKRAYRFRFYPTPEQARELNRTFGCVRFVWNWALDLRTREYRVNGNSVNYVALSSLLTELKRQPDTAFLSEVSSVPTQQVLRHLQVAFGNFFAKRNRYPRFKSRYGKQSLEYTVNGFRLKDGNLFLAKMADPIKVKWSRAVPGGTPSTVTVSRDSADRWHVSMLFDDTIDPFPRTGAVVGIDLGLKDFLVTSDGERINSPQFLRKKEQRLARYQRMMSKKVKGSANRVKAKKKVAKIHAQVSDARKDFLHKTSTDVVQRYDVIAIEDLAVKNMVKNHSLAKSISDSGWGQFREFLTYKSEWYGKRLVVINRWHPSSKLCSDCGHLLRELSLGTRQWTCPSCGTWHDRDINAAKNILAEGLSVAGIKPSEACGAGVRHVEATPVRPAVKQELTYAGGSG